MPTMEPWVVTALAVTAVVVGVTVLLGRLRVIAQPDEWLLALRDGRLLRAGIGIRSFRWPGDVIVRFSSTVQRVGFSVRARTRERLPVSIEGFVLWCVAPAGDGPFRAFRTLGLVNLDAPTHARKSDKHLLTTPQHHAFQRMLAATAQRLAATHALDQLLLDQASLVAEIHRALAPLEAEMGARVEQVEIVAVQPVDEALQRDLSADVEERVREAAARVRLEAEERGKQRALESEQRLARDRASAEQEALTQDKARRLAEIVHGEEVATRAEAAKRLEALSAEARATDVARAVLAREELVFSAGLDRRRREAETERDAISALASAEERKSQAVRDHELGRLVAEKVGDALGHLPLKEARWITVGQDSPVQSLAALVGAARAVVGKA